jgi:predicted deacylase
MPERYPIEISPPDISRYREGNTGVDYVHTLDSGKPGSSVMVQALTHGNEFSGAIALDYLFRQEVRPARGKLTLAFANIAAFARFDPAKPSPSRYIDEDYNRVWADDVLDGPRDSAELRRARELRPFVDAADYLLDLHSMSEACRPIMVCGKSEKSVALSRRMGVPADLLLDTGHPAGLRMIERGAFNNPQSPRTAILIETGQHWEKSAVEVAIDTTLRFLVVTGAVDEGWAKSRLRLKPPAVQRLVRVTEAVVAKSTAFRFARPWKGLEVVPKAGTLLANDGDTEWRTPYDDCVLVMPGTTNLKPGNTTARLGRYED